MSEEKITYKGFNADWTCRGFQFEIGKEYVHEGKVEACASGFHACEYPLDVFSYYAPAGNNFAVVKQSGDLCAHDGDTKIASSKLHVSAEISFAGLIKAAIEYTVSKCNPVDPSSQASSTGDYGAASSTGDYGAASSTGYQGAASSTGDYGAASSTGYRGAASSTGKNGIAVASGKEGKAMASEGSAIVLCAYDDEVNLLHVKSAIAGRGKIKANVWYTLNEKGNFVECK